MSAQVSTIQSPAAQPSVWRVTCSACKTVTQGTADQLHEALTVFKKEPVNLDGLGNEKCPRCKKFMFCGGYWYDKRIGRWKWKNETTGKWIEEDRLELVGDNTQGEF